MSGATSLTDTTSLSDFSDVELDSSQQSKNLDETGDGQESEVAVNELKSHPDNLGRYENYIIADFSYLNVEHNFECE